MTEYSAPGVYVEELPRRPKPIAGARTDVAAFVGPTVTGAERDGLPTLVRSLAEFERTFGGAEDLRGDAGRTPNYMAHSARAYFENGGARLYIVRTSRIACLVDYTTALQRLREVAEVSIVAAPGYSTQNNAAALQQALIDHVEDASSQHVYQFAVLDSAPQASPAELESERADLETSRAALYYPWIKAGAPGDAVELSLPPSGYVRGIYARVARERGVWKAPANERVRGALALQQDLDAPTQQHLNALGINCIRHFPGRGVLVWGARTLSGDPEWKYVSVRRLCMFLEQSLYEGLQWAACEANGPMLWERVCQCVDEFLMGEWRGGALQGATPREAFFVRCDRSTMTRADLQAGRLICEVGVAPVKPAEFVIFRLSLITGTDE